MARLVGYGGDVVVATQLIHACDVAWDELVDGDVTLSLDTSDYKVGSGSNKMVCAAGLAANDILATDDIVSLDITAYDIALAWFKCSIGVSAGDFHLLMDEAANCANGDIVEDIPALTANTWKLCRVPITTTGMNAIISVGIEMQVDVGACTLWVDEIRVGTSVAGIRSWSLDYIANVVDSTSFQDGQAKVFTVTQMEWSGSFDGFKDGAPLTIGEVVHLELRESSTSTQQWRGSAIITAARPSESVDGLVMYSYDFQGIHALEVATA